MRSKPGESEEGGEEEVQEPVKLNSSPASPKRSHGGQGLYFASGLFLKPLISVSDPKRFSLSSPLVHLSRAYSVSPQPRRLDTKQGRFAQMIRLNGAVHMSAISPNALPCIFGFHEHLDAFRKVITFILVGL